MTSSDPEHSAARRRLTVPELPDLEPLPVGTPLIVVIGIGAWVVALAVTLLVPALHTGDRSWWPWACVAGVGLGALGLAYVLRGRGNAQGALDPRR